MNKNALRNLLKERRQCIDPAEYGEKVRQSGRGRRARGLTQHKVDELTGRTYGTLRRLESGAYENPPADLLRDVALLLRFNEHEWVLLYRYALGHEPPAPLHPQSGFEVPSSWQSAVDGVSHMAYVTDAAWQVVAHNEHWPTMFPGGRPPSNIMRWMCLDPQAREVLGDWETAWAPRIMPQLRAAAAIHQHSSPVVKQLEADVLADPVAGPLYDTKGILIHPDGDERPLHHPKWGKGWVTMCSATPEGSPGARLMILLFRPGMERPTPHTILRAPETS